MSIYRSYFSKNNTIVANSDVNTAKNPVTQLFYGKNRSGKCIYTGLSGDTCSGRSGFTQSVVNGYSRFLFGLDLDDLTSKVGSCCISSGDMTHTLKMTNTSNFDDALLNEFILIDGTRRATSFDLMLFKVSGGTWDEGVGYDYQLPRDMFGPEFDLTHSTRPSNWFSSTTITAWGNSGTYINSSPATYSVLATQSFDNGNENIEFSSPALDTEINSLLTGTPQSTYGIAFIPSFENLSGLTQAYSVGFFTKYTQTFYEPFLESYYDHTINDNRSNFNLHKTNRLFLYVYDYNGKPICLDVLPVVNIISCDGLTVLTPIAKKLTCGVYYIELNITSIPGTVPTLYEDVWSNISIGGVIQPDMTNEFVIYDNAYSIGSTAGVPTIYGYSVSGLKENEKITSGESRKVFISARVPYTTDEQALIDTIQYRLYVTQGTTQVEVTPWTAVNKTFTSNYLLLDTSWMIPNEYYLDIKATSNEQVDIYRKVITFQIVNQL